MSAFETILTLVMKISVVFGIVFAVAIILKSGGELIISPMSGIMEAVHKWRIVVMATILVAIFIFMIFGIDNTLAFLVGVGTAGFLINEVYKRQATC